MLVLIILIGTLWIRTASRRRRSMEKLRRLESTSNGHHTNTTGQAGYGAGYLGYPSHPLPNPHASQFAHGYGQPLPYNGQRGYGNEYPVYVLPYSPNPVYNPSHTPILALP